MFEKQEKLEDNDLILAIRYSRKIDSGHCIKFKNKYYQTIAQDGRLVTLKPKSKCMVIESYSKGLYLECADQIYNLDEVLLHKAHSKNIDLEIAEAKPRKVNKPASNHPWKNDNILKHQQRLKESIPILEQYFKDCDYV